MFRGIIELLTYPEISDRGRLVSDYDAEPAVLPVFGVDVQPGASTELIAERRDATAVRYTVIIPFRKMPAQLNERSIIRVPTGEICQVDGRPMPWVDGSPLDHYVVILVAWEIPE